VLVPVGVPRDASQIADVVVPGIPVNVVNVHPFRDRPVVMRPNVSMQTVASPRKISAVRRIVALRIATVRPAIEDHRFDLNAS
jgi:hypothetical protein